MRQRFEAAQRAYAFADLCERLFVAKGYKTASENTQPGISLFNRIDFAAVKDQEPQVLVDVKWSSRLQVSLSILRNMAASIHSRLGSWRGASKVVMILPCEIVAEHREWVQSEFSVEIWDRDRLRRFAQGTGLESELEGFPFNSRDDWHRALA